MTGKKWLYLCLTLLLVLAMVTMASAEEDTQELPPFKVTMEQLANGLVRLSWENPREAVLTEEGTESEPEAVTYEVVVHYCQTDAGPYTEIDRQQVDTTFADVVAMPGCQMLYTVTELVDGRYDTIRYTMESVVLANSGVQLTSALTWEENGRVQSAKEIPQAEVAASVETDEANVAYGVNLAWSGKNLSTDAEVLVIAEAPSGYRMLLTHGILEDYLSGSSFAADVSLGQALQNLQAYTGYIPVGEYTIDLVVNGSIVAKDSFQLTKDD